MKIVTGYRGEPHITSEQDRAKNQGFFGEGSYVLDVGTKLRADLESGNEIRIHDGVISHQGCVAVIEKGAYDSLILSNGTQGRQRIDLIVARYEKDVETEVESLDLYVIEGTPVTSDPQVPAYQAGDIQSGDILVDMPLYTVLLDGVQVSTITSVHETISNIKTLIATAKTLGDTKVNRAGDTMTGNLTVRKTSGDTGFYAERSDVGVKVSLEVGSSGTNHGVYSYKQMKWILYATDTDVFAGAVKVTTAADARSSIAAVYKAGDIMTGNLIIDRSGTTYDAVVEAKRGGRVQLCSNGANDRHGVYSPTIAKWLTRVDGSDIFAGSVNVTSAADARTSLGLDGVGTVQANATKSGSKTISSNTAVVNGNSFTLPAGTWLVIAKMEYEGNVSEGISGNPMIHFWIATSASSGTGINNTHTSVTPALYKREGATTLYGYGVITIVAVLKPTASTTYYLNGGKNTDKNVTFTTTHTLLRIL